MNRLSFFVGAVAVLLATPPACRSPKKIFTERDKQQVKDSILTEVPTGPEIIPVNANFDDKVTLVAYSVNKQHVQPGDTVALTLYWKSVAKLEGDFKIFVHLDSARARKTYDHYAINGLYTTSKWNPGEVIRDDVAISIDQDFPEGPAKLWVGFFDATAWKNERKNIRLDIKDPGTARSDKQNRLLVTSFMIGDVKEKKLVVRKVSSPLSIDGRLDEPAWEQALLETGAFHTPEGKPLPDTESVQAGLLWDDEFLYIGFNVKDNDLDTPYTTRDSTLWSGRKSGASDVVEIFLDPMADGKEYIELQISPADVVFDAKFDSYRSPAWSQAKNFNLNLKHKVLLKGTLNDNVPDEGYVVEVAIPWTEIPGGAEARQAPFKLNLFRLSNSGSWAGVWSPVGNDFHDLTLAGLVTFGQ